MGVKLQDGSKDYVPGPADYDPNSSVKAKKEPAFTMSAKLNDAGDKV